MDVKKEDVRNIMSDIGKDIGDPINFSEFVKIMVPRLVY